MKTKKRRVSQVSEVAVGQDSSPIDTASGGFNPWLGGDDLSTAFDAPTVRLEGTENRDMGGAVGNFSNLGSVLGKLDTFRSATQRLPTTLSTVPSFSIGTIVPAGPPAVSDGEVSTLTGLTGYSEKILLETDCPVLTDKFSKIYDQLVCYASKRIDVRAFVTALIETNHGWAVMEIPGPFNTVGYVQLQSEGGVVRAMGSGIQLRGDRQLVAELEAFGVTVAVHTANTAVKNKAATADDSSSEEETVSGPVSLHISGRENVFGFFDCLINNDVFADPRRPSRVHSSFAFNGATILYPAISVKDSANNRGFRFVHLDRICVPYDVLESFIDAALLLAPGTVKAHIQTAPKAGSINLVKRI